MTSTTNEGDPVPDWWTDPRLAFAEGGRVGYAAGLADALEAVRELYGPWKFDAAEVWRGLERRKARDAERAERARRGVSAPVRPPTAGPAWPAAPSPPKGR